MKLNWEEVSILVKNKKTLRTKSGAPFQLLAISNDTIIIRVSTGNEHTLSRKNLEEAVCLLQNGEKITGPKDYRDLVADERPAYAWAILKHLGYLD